MSKDLTSVEIAVRPVSSEEGGRVGGEVEEKVYRAGLGICIIVIIFTLILKEMMNHYWEFGGSNDMTLM